MNKETYYSNRKEKNYAERPEKMWDMYKAGITQRAIAAKFGVTPTRVSQILKERAFKKDEPWLKK